MADNRVNDLVNVQGYSLPRHVLLAVLGEFGISTAQSRNVQLEYTIELQSSTWGSIIAAFDPSSKQWRPVDDWPDWEGAASSQSAMRSIFESPLKEHPSSPRPKSRADYALKESGSGDWTIELPDTEHVRSIKSTAWEKTPLGPMREWPRSLQLMVHQLIVDPRSSALYWGPERISLYNEQAVPLLGDIHPHMLGMPYKAALPLLNPIMEPVFTQCDKTHMPAQIHEVEFMVQRKGFLEEAWFDGTFVPVFSPEKRRVEGIYHQTFEVSRQKFTDRRNKLLNSIASTPNFGKISVWQHILEGLGSLGRDIPIAIIYSAEESGPASTCSLQLEGTLGVTRGHTAAPEKVELHEDGLEGFAPAIRQARSRGIPIVFRSMGEDLPPFLTKDIHWRGFEEPSHTIIVIPLVFSGQTAGILIVGTNPRTEYDDDYQQFIQELGRLSSAALSSSIGFDAARAREAKLYKELTDTERFIRRVADITPAGLYSLSAMGLLTWANSKFFEISGLSANEEDRYKLSFMDCIHDEYVGKAYEAWVDACKRTDPTASEFKLKRKWTPPSNNEDGASPEEHAWILATYAPNFENGQVVGVTGCLTDISSLKWAERVHANAAEAAREAKRLQEKFIDVTSHEMRNPLSAIMQCADSIAATVEMLKDPHTTSVEPLDNLESISDSAQTILLCASHQKRIVDDILTVSKLDSTLLTVFSTIIRPYDVVREALQMFKAELNAFEISQRITVEPSFAELGADVVYCDPARLSQILVNLLTNALKFTKTSLRREVNVRLGASLQAPPSDVGGNPQWFPSNQERKPKDEASLGPTVYLTFAVQDTGRGITAEEMSRLFSRFAQANAKTHIQYGGSGLGLFISRELTELMGGMIGANSIPDCGSTFAFFIKAQKPDRKQLQATQSQDLTRDVLMKLPSPGSVPSPIRNSAPTPRKGPSILLVEDNLVNQKVLSKQLQRLGAAVHIANHGIEALTFIRTTRFWRANNGEGEELTVILMDWEMPVMDGLTCTKEIRKMEAANLLTSHLTVIAVTANARAEQMQMAYNAGVDDLVTKPFKVPALMLKIEQL